MKRTRDALKIGDEFVYPDYTLFNSVCKYSENTLFRKRCPDYQTDKCASCWNNHIRHPKDKPIKQKKTSYYDFEGSHYL